MTLIVMVADSEKIATSFPVKISKDEISSFCCILYTTNFYLSIHSVVSVNIYEFHISSNKALSLAWKIKAKK